MLMMLLALSMAVIDQNNRRVESYEVPVRLTWDEHGHIKWPEGSIVNLHPSMRLKESQGLEVRTSLLDMPSFDPWVNFIDNLYVEELAPRRAMPVTSNQIWDPVKVVERTRYRMYGAQYPGDLLSPSPHCPWHVTIQIHCPQFFSKEPVLHYDIIRTPSSDSPYYEATVSSMPNIQCRGKTKEELEQQLLKEYACYLSNLEITEEAEADRARSQKVLRRFIAGVSSVE